MSNVKPGDLAMFVDPNNFGKQGQKGWALDTNLRRMPPPEKSEELRNVEIVA